MDNIVYYFSGTGNCLAAAKRIAANIENCKVQCICEELFSNPHADGKFESITVIFPSYGYGAPKLVRRFFREYPLDCNYLSIGVTMGSDAGGTLQSVKRLLKRRKIEASYYLKIKAVENFLPFFGAPKEVKIDKRNQLQNEAVDSLIAANKAREKNSIKGVKPVSAFVSTLFRTATPLLTKLVRIKKTCNACGLCKKICPANAIIIKNERKAKIKASKCNQCQACLNACPKKSISMMRLNKKCARYRHRDVTISELHKRD